MAKIKTTYMCKNCGAKSLTWAGKCSACGSWDSLEEVVEAASRGGKSAPSTPSVRLLEVSTDENERLRSSYAGWDAVLGEGLVRDSVSILTARPGAGKSTLLLQMAQEYAKSGLTVLYASGEESASQIKSRADRLFDKIHPGIWLLSTSELDAVVEQAQNTSADVLVIDSIQTFRLSEHPQRAGSPVQTVACTDRIVDLCKDPVKKRAAILVGHMTKSDEMAGLRTLEHMVDTVLLLEGDPLEELRILRSTKNRFGATGEIGLFEMKAEGLVEVTDPSAYFVTQREESAVIGAARTVTSEGSRMLIVEVESLVSKSFMPYPMRISENVYRDRLNTLLSILEERAGIGLSDKNVIVKTTGGIKLAEQGADLAVLMSIASSAGKLAIPTDTVFLAEVGLTGELKKVSRAKQRIKELAGLGYRQVFTAPQPGLPEEGKLKIRQVRHLREVIQAVSGK